MGSIADCRLHPSCAFPFALISLSRALSSLYQREIGGLFCCRLSVIMMSVVLPIWS